MALESIGRMDKYGILDSIDNKLQIHNSINLTAEAKKTKEYVLSDYICINSKICRTKQNKQISKTLQC